MSKYFAWCVVEFYKGNAGRHYGNSFLCVGIHSHHRLNLLQYVSYVALSFMNYFITCKNVLVYVEID